MPGFIVHQGAVVFCSHAGTATPTAPNPRVLVSGQPVTTIVAPYTIAGCPLNTPCVTGQWSSGSTRVFASGLPLVLNSSLSTCVPTGSPLKVITTQTRVQAT